MKYIGYTILGVGALAVIASFPQVQTALKFSIPNIANNILLYGGVVLALVGAFLATKDSKGKQPEEVPIYEGHGKQQKIVGYRKMKK